MLLLLLGLALLAGAGVFLAFHAIALPSPRVGLRAATFQEGLQVRLAQQGLAITPPEFLLRGARYGLGAGFLALLAVRTPVVLLPCFAGGFVFLWAQLEDQRNRRSNRYHHALAGAIDIIINSWQIHPSLDGALQAVAAYGAGAGDGPEGGPLPDSVAADFAEVRAVWRSGSPLREALQRVADRRASPLFDNLAIALLVAHEQGASASEILRQQAVIARRQVNLFNTALNRQRTKRQELRDASVFPWLIVIGVGLLSRMAAAETVDTQTFFTTPLGAAVAFLAALITIGTYVMGLRRGNRGLLLQRVPTEWGRANEEVAHA